MVLPEAIARIKNKTAYGVCWQLSAHLSLSVLFWLNDLRAEQNWWNWAVRVSPAGLISSDQTVPEMSVLMNLTEPSHVVTSTPPGCLRWG